MSMILSLTGQGMPETASSLFLIMAIWMQT